MNTKHSIADPAEYAGKEIAEAFLRAKMYRNFEEMATRELSELHDQLIGEDRQMEASAAASAIRTLESRRALWSLRSRNDTAQALHALRDSALCAAGEQIRKITHAADESVLHIHLHCGIEVAVSGARFDARLFDVRWGPERCAHLNFAFNVAEAAVLSILAQ